MVKRFTFSFFFLSMLTLQISYKSNDFYIPVAILIETGFIEDAKKSFILMPTEEKASNTMIWYYAPPRLGALFNIKNV